MPITVLAAGAVLAAVHLFAGKLRFLHVIPRSRWLSLAGGISVAYVFVHLLPELSEAQEALGDLGGLPGAVERHAYLLALVGLVLFHAIERVTVRARGGRGGGTRTPGAGTRDGIFWLSTASFALYNGAVGYLLVHRAEIEAGLTFYAVAMAVHFLVNDHGLREHHEDLYTNVARWVLAAAVAAGIALGSVVSLPEWAPLALVAFLAGGVVLNVLKEELPEERESRMSAFVAGALGYAALLLAT